MEKSLSVEEMIQNVDQQIREVRQKRSEIAESIRKLEDTLMACNEQIEQLLDLRWSSQVQQTKIDTLNEMKKIMSNE